MKQLTKTLLATSICLVWTGSAQAAGELNLYAWADSISPDLIKKFEKEVDVKVNMDAFSSNEDALTKLQAGDASYDLVTPSQHFVKIMLDSGLLLDIAADQLDAFKQVDEKWKKQWWDPESKYSIPLAYGSAGFTVNRDQYKGPVDSWKVYFEPSEELKGKMASLATPDEVVSAAQLYLGIEYCTENSDDMKKVYELLKAQKPFIAAYSSDNIENRVGGGEVAIHFWWDGNTLRLRNTGKQVEYSAPKEGLVGWLDSFVVPKGAKNVENAKAFINFMSKEENATEQYNFYAHASPVKLDLSKAKFNKENAPELFPTVPVKMTKACSPKAQELINKVWTQLLQ
ncbi:MAG: extracellular solute-binding protein [Thiothrix sp.]|nr:MAG: extracellular solute-binding protein [Thiothrix sp.]